MPKWNETFDIEVKQIDDELTLTIYDEDITTNDVVGYTTINMS